MAILIDKAQADLARFAGDDSLPRRLDRVHLTEKRVEATNEHVALTLEHDTMSPDEYPQIEGAGEGSGPVNACVPASIVLDAARALPKRPHIPILSYLRVAQKEKRVILTSTDLERTSITPVVLEADAPTYPNLDAVMPARDGRIKVTLNARYLKLLADYALKHGPRAATGVTFYVERLEVDPEVGHAETIEAVRVEIRVRDGEARAVGCLMPMRD